MGLIYYLLWTDLVANITIMSYRTQMIGVVSRSYTGQLNVGAVQI
jgi:hypothetical protein